MKISSPEFTHEGFVPNKFTCWGKGINPSLEIKDIPQKAKSLVLIIEDVDSPIKVFVHWLVYDIPITQEIEEDSIPGTQGMNNYLRLDFGPFCPPAGVHRNFFKIYALDTTLNLPEGCSKNDVEKAMEGHILEMSQMIGLSKKSKIE